MIVERFGRILPIAVMAFAIVALLFFIDLSLGIFGGQKSSPTNTTVICDNDARICPDGSYVGRTELNCSFAACDAVTAPSGRTENFSGQFSFDYPIEWGDPTESNPRPETDSDLATGSVSQVSFVADNRYLQFSIFSDGVTGNLPYSNEAASRGDCVNGLMTYEPGRVGVKLPCKDVTINGRRGVLYVRNVAQEGCYDLTREYYLDWPESPYRHALAYMGGVEIYDVPGPNGEIYCTQTVDVAQRMQEVLDEKNLTTEQQRRIDEFEAVVNSLSAS